MQLFLVNATDVQADAEPVHADQKIDDEIR